MENSFTRLEVSKVAEWMEEGRVENLKKSKDERVKKIAWSVKIYSMSEVVSREANSFTLCRYFVLFVVWKNMKTF